jgi:hypothetical protein
MERCPICRAVLNGAETCRRCRAELHSAKRAEREGQALTDAAIHCLARDDIEGAEGLLQRALLLHAAPETRALWRIVSAVE